MTKTILAFLAAASIALGICAATPLHRAFAMGQQPQETWVQPVHKQTHKAHRDHRQTTAPTPHARPVEAPAPVVVREPTPAPQAAPAPPPAPVKASYMERNHKELMLVGKVLGLLLIGGALTILFRTGQTIYAGYKAKKGTATA